MKLAVLIFLGYVFAKPPIDREKDWVLAWSDEFNGNSLDMSKWSYEVDCWGGGNEEKQCYINDPSTLYVRNGILVMNTIYHPNGYRGSATNCTNNNQNSCTWTQPATSAKIITRHKGGSWRYGYFEMRVRMPQGDFFWPAWWLMPTDNEYGRWAASGEIDILEARGQVPYATAHTLHHGGLSPNNTHTGSSEVTTGINYQSDYFVTALRWSAGRMTWYIDGKEIYTSTLERNFYSGRGPNPYRGNRQPFDKRFYMILNVAVAGTYFSPGRFGTFNPARDSQSWQRGMVIDYIRVYQ